MNEWTATSPSPTTGNVWSARLICGLRIQPLKRKGSPSSMLPVLVSFFFSFFLAIFWNGANSTTAGYSRPFIETCAKRHYETVPSSLRKTIIKLPWGWSMASDCFGKSGWQRSQSLLHDMAPASNRSLEKGGNSATPHDFQVIYGVSSVSFVLLLLVWFFKTGILFQLVFLFGSVSSYNWLF